MLWVVFTIIAAAAQTARNAMQRELTGTLAGLRIVGVSARGARGAPPPARGGPPQKGPART